MQKCLHACTETFQGKEEKKAAGKRTFGHSIVAERLSARQLIPHRISEIVSMYVCMYVCMYPSCLGMQLFRERDAVYIHMPRQYHHPTRNTVATFTLQ